MSLLAMSSMSFGGRTGEVGGWVKSMTMFGLSCRKALVGNGSTVSHLRNTNGYTEWSPGLVGLLSDNQAVFLRLYWWSLAESSLILSLPQLFLRSFQPVEHRNVP